MEEHAKALAYQIARRAFENKKDRAGKPYFEHLMRVAEKFKDSNNSNVLYPAAILHDLLEDCHEWNEISLRHLFSKNIVDTIVILTKKKGEDYMEYINRINENNWASDIKIADLKDNMDITRLSEIGSQDFHRLQKYLSAYKILTYSDNHY